MQSQSSLEVQTGCSFIPSYGDMLCNTSQHDLFGGELSLQRRRRAFRNLSNCILNLETRFDGVKQDDKLSTYIVFI